MKPSTHPNARLYRAPDYRWVARDLDDPQVVWTWQPYSGSWSMRERYTGPEPEQLAFADAFRAYNTGWPGARPLPRVAPEEKRSAMLQVMVTTQTYQRVQAAAAAAGDKSASSWCNERIIEALASASAAAETDATSPVEAPPA